jgi:hypothetical protein
VAGGERVWSLSWLSWRSLLAAIPSEVIASSNTNIVSHRVFEREEAFVCFVCENGLLGSPVIDCKAFSAIASYV